MAVFNSLNHVLNLPDAYKKTNESNNYKILNIEQDINQQIRQDLNDISDILDYDHAIGNTLDNYGYRVGQLRGQADDEKYLLLIRAKILRNLSNGTISSILTSLKETFRCEYSDIELKEHKRESCYVSIISLPLSVINEMGFTANQVIAMIRGLLPVGIYLETLLFEGTFSFASGSEWIYDENTGFSDIDSPELGGYLGVIEGEKYNDDLPI